MGLLDRDYMHERHRQARTKVRPFPSRAAASMDKWPMKRVVLWTVNICLLAYLSIKYLILQAGVVPFPNSGEAIWFAPHEVSAVAPLTVKAPSRGDSFYAVRVQESGSGRLIVLIPLRKGETITVQVPLGQYEMTFASGSRWYGPEKLFGFLGEKKKAVKTFDFYRSGSVTTGNTIDLTNRIDGNLPTRALTPFEK